MNQLETIEHIKRELGDLIEVVKLPVKLKFHNYLIKIKSDGRFYVVASIGEHMNYLSVMIDGQKTTYFEGIDDRICTVDFIIDTLNKICRNYVNV